MAGIYQIFKLHVAWPIAAIYTRPIEKSGAYNPILCVLSVWAMASESTSGCDIDLEEVTSNLELLVAIDVVDCVFDYCQCHVHTQFDKKANDSFVFGLVL